MRHETCVHKQIIAVLICQPVTSAISHVASEMLFGWLLVRFNANVLLSCKKKHTQTLLAYTFPRSPPVEAAEVLSVDVCISSRIQQLNYQ